MHCDRLAVAEMGENQSTKIAEFERIRVDGQQSMVFQQKLTDSGRMNWKLHFLAHQKDLIFENE